MFDARIAQSAAVCLALALSTSLMVPALQGQSDREWISETGGAWIEAENWLDDEIPGPDDFAIFDLDQDPAYEVELSVSTSVTRFIIGDDRVELNVSTGQTLSVTDEATPTGSPNPWPNNNGFFGTTGLMIARGDTNADQEGYLLLSNGRMEVESFMIAGTTGSVGSLHISGAQTVFDSLGTVLNSATVGYLGDATLLIDQGAEANFSRLTLARHGAASATVTVTGAGSKLTFDELEVAIRGESLLEVTDGAVLEGSGNVELAQRADPGTIRIQNATADIDGNIRIGRFQSTGTIEVLDGSQMTVGGYIWAGENDASNAANGTGILTVSGENSQLINTNYVVLGGRRTVDNEGIGIINLSDGGAMSITQELRIWSRGSVTIDGGTLIAGEWLASADSTLSLTLQTGVFAAPIQIGSLFTETGNAVIGDSIFELMLGPGFSANLEEVFEIMTYGGELTGTFAGLSEGDIIHLDGYQFQLSYGSGSSDMISLTVIPEPGVVVLLLLGAVLAGFRRRTH